MALSCLAVVLSFSASTPAPAIISGNATVIGPVLAANESPTFTNGRDGGISVALPNGKALWVLGDTPTYHYLNAKWYPKAFVTGTSAEIGSYVRGRRPTAMYDVNVGQPLAAANQPARFVPTPTVLYLPDGSHQLCTIPNGALEAVRWAAGAALMPDQTNVLVTFVDVCVTPPATFTVEGWGFMEYNWVTNTISVPATDVFVPATSGAALASSKLFGSPIIVNNEVTMFSGKCCSPAVVYSTTFAATTAALQNPNSYVLHPISGLSSPIDTSVTVESYSPLKLQLFGMTDLQGTFAVFSASSPAGPWTQEASGSLPGCEPSSGTPLPCNSFFVHPELSTPAQLMVSYYQPGYGPGYQTHPDNSLNHLVMASVTVGASLPPLEPYGVRAVPLGATALTGSLKVSYRAGLNNGATIMKYRAACTSTDGGVSRFGVHIGTNPVPITLAGATTGRTYRCTVTETNAKGLSPVSPVSKPVIVGAPGAPVGVHAARQPPGRLKVTFTPGPSNGAPITRFSAYCASSNGGITRAGVGNPITVTRLSPGKTYTCGVHATNSRGNGPSAASSPVIV